MPFVAVKPDGERVCSLDHDDLRLTCKPGDFSCQLCGGEMIYKRGVKVRPHFAHKADECGSDYEHKPESQKHLDAKVRIRDQLLEKYPEAVVDLEVPVPEIRRIADVMLTINGWRNAYEVQWSRIPVEQFEQRTRDYESQGINVQWWIGGEANNESTRQWSIERFGEVLAMELHRDFS